MRIADMIERLKDQGMTDARISKEINISQSAISKIRRGIIKDPMHSTYCEIERLYRLAILNESPLGFDRALEKDHQS